MPVAKNVRVIWDQDNGGWFVRYDTDEFKDLDEPWGMPKDLEVSLEDMMSATKEALKWAGLEMPPEYELID